MRMQSRLWKLGESRIGPRCVRQIVGSGAWTEGLLCNPLANAMALLRPGARADDAVLHPSLISVRGGRACRLDRAGGVRNGPGNAGTQGAPGSA